MFNPPKILKKESHVNTVEESLNEFKSEYVFGLKFRSMNNYVSIFVDELKLSVMIDSGSSCNLIDRLTWEKINANFIEPVSLSKVKRNVDAYGSTTPLKIIGFFKTVLRWRENCLKEVEFLVYDVEGPSNWVSPVIIVPKSDNDIRLCVDMRRANTAISRVRYPIPTIDEILQDLNQSKVFSKLDKMGLPSD